MEPASTNHVSSTVVGAVVGGLAAGAVVAAAPIVLPAIGLAALGTSAVALVTSIPWAGAAIGGWIGYNHAENKAIAKGFSKGADKS